MEYQTIKGERVPSLGLGTWRLSGKECARTVERALSLGYRHLDTAQMYRNEDEVGQGIKRSGVDREEVFLVTKVWPSDFSRDDWVWVWVCPVSTDCFSSFRLSSAVSTHPSISAPT